jgi:hypothetical protein
MSTRKKLSLVWITAFAALALASIGWAAIPDNGGVIHGCYKKDTGTLRVYDTDASPTKPCTSKEASLDWSQQGGATDAYVNYSTGLAVVDQTTWPGAVVASRSLPAGSYFFAANLGLKGYLGSYPAGTTSCRLVAHDNVTNHDYWANGRGTYPADGYTPLGLSTSYIFGADGGTITVSCISPALAQVESVSLTALKVGQVHF